MWEAREGSQRLSLIYNKWRSFRGPGAGVSAKERVACRSADIRTPSRPRRVNMQTRPLHLAIIGAGIGGLTAAACLRSIGIDVRIYEQARGFTRLGAGIQQAPNAVRVLYALGLEAKLLAGAFQPESNDSP